jgi:hypothetical protein
MIISFFLSVMMLAAVGAGLGLRRRAPAIGAAIAIAAMFGLYFVWVPEQLTDLAHYLGVGRGADLVLYLWVSLTFLAVAGLVLEIRHLQRQLTLLAREQALQRARREWPPGDPASDPAAVGQAADDGAIGSTELAR